MTVNVLSAKFFVVFIGCFFWKIQGTVVLGGLRVQPPSRRLLQAHVVFDRHDTVDSANRGHGDVDVGL